MCNIVILCGKDEPPEIGRVWQSFWSRGTGAANLRHRMTQIVDCESAPYKMRPGVRSEPVVCSLLEKRRSLALLADCGAVWRGVR